MSRDGAPRRVDQDHPVAYRFDEPSKGSLQHIRSRRDIARRLSVETAIIVERDQHMRILAVMRHDDGLARRLQSPIDKAANEIRRRYALWFLCRRHAPPPIYRNRKSVVEGKSVAVSVDLGGRRINKTKKKRIIKN